MAEAIYINSAHQRVIGRIEFKKDWPVVRSSDTDGKECVVLIWRDRPGFESAF